MGRKIPGKKHRGVKDPCEQSARRNMTLLKKINAPPSNPDEQDLPKSVERIMQLKQAVKEGKFSRKRKKKRNRNVSFDQQLLPGMTRPVKPTPVFRRARGESDSQFVHRMEAECKEVIAEAQFEKEFDVCVERDPETGDVTGVTKRQKIELDRIMERYTKKAGNEDKNKMKGVEEDDHLTKQKSGRPGKKERWKLRKKEKQLKLKQKEIDEFEHFRDNVKFGEVVHAPPVLKPPRNVTGTSSNDEMVPRPGKRNLLLTPLLSTTANSATDTDRLRQEQQRKRVVEAYRQLKAQAKLR